MTMLLRGAALALAALCGLPVAGASASSMAGTLDIPVAVPPQFRGLVRERLHPPKPSSNSESTIELENRRGYSISVIGRAPVVAILVTRAKGGDKAGGSLFADRAVSAYVARGTVRPNRIDASFGDLGRVDVRFHPSGRVERTKPRSHCRGADRITSRFGVFAGKIRFSDEGNYLSIKARRAKGHVSSPLRLRCASRHFRLVRRSGRPSHGRSPRGLTILDADWRQGVTATHFLALQVKTNTLFLAVSEQSLGTIAKVRYALAIGTETSLTANDALTSAKASPPAPFEHSGFYSAAPDGSKTWTGPLSVSFPGAPRFPLTGPQFEPVLDAGF